MTEATRFDRRKQRTRQQLMDAAATSHPFYWAAFAIVGDGEKPVRSE